MAVASVNVKLNVQVYECVLFFLLSKKNCLCASNIKRTQDVCVLTCQSGCYKCDRIFMFQIMCILCSITQCLSVSVLCISGFGRYLCVSHNQCYPFQVTYSPGVFPTPVVRYFKGLAGSILEIQKTKCQPFNRGHVALCSIHLPSPYFKYLHSFISVEFCQL